MRAFAGVLVLLAVMCLLLTGSSLALPALQSEDVGGGGANLQVEFYAHLLEDLANYEEQLIQEAQTILEEQVGEYRREEAQKLHSELLALQDELTREIEVRQKELSTQLLGLQLELFLVSLTASEQEQKLAEVITLQEELQQARADWEAEYEARAQQLQDEHEERLRRRIANLELELDRAVSAELDSYQRQWLQLKPDLASTLADRSY